MPGLAGERAARLVVVAVGCACGPQVEVGSDTLASGSASGTSGAMITGDAGPVSSTTSASENTGSPASTGGSGDTASDATTQAAIDVDDEFCKQFTTEEDCEGAVPGDAPIQCAFTREFIALGRVTETASGEACISYLNDVFSDFCLAVEYVPFACDLGPPRDLLAACVDEEGILPDEWPSRPPTNGTANHFWLSYDPRVPNDGLVVPLPCHYRRHGHETCWEKPAPGCSCYCLPFACLSDGVWQICEDASTGGSDGASTDTGEPTTSAGSG